MTIEQVENRLRKPQREDKILFLLLLQQQQQQPPFHPRRNQQTRQRNIKQKSQLHRQKSQLHRQPRALRLLRSCQQRLSRQHRALTGVLGPFEVPFEIYFYQDLDSQALLSVSYTAFKESGFNRAQALADCESRGQRLANIHSADEQAAINDVIINAGGTDRAFWLGMIEDGPCPDKNGIKVCVTHCVS